MGRAGRRWVRCGQASALGGCGLMENLAYLLGAVVGDFDTDMRLICREGCAEAFLLTLREPIARGAQEIADLVEGIACGSAVTGRVLLDAAASLTWGITGELDDMEGVEHAGCVLELAKRWRSCCPLEGIQPPIRTPARKSFPRSASQFSCTVPDLPGTRSNNLAVGWSFPRVVHDASELVGHGGGGPGDATHAHQPPAPACLRNERGHQMRLADAA